MYMYPDGSETSDPMLVYLVEILDTKHRDRAMYQGLTAYQVTHSQ